MFRRNGLHVHSQRSFGELYTALQLRYLDFNMLIYFHIRFTRNFSYQIVAWRKTILSLLIRLITSNRKWNDHNIRNDGTRYLCVMNEWLPFNIHQGKPCVHGAKGVWSVLRAYVWVQRLLLPHKNWRKSNIWQQKSGMEMSTRHRFCVGDTSAFLLCVRLARTKIDTWLWCHKQSPPLPPVGRFIHRCIDEWIDKLIIRALLSLDSSTQTFVSVVEREKLRPEHPLRCSQTATKTNNSIFFFIFFAVAVATATVVDVPQIAASYSLFLSSVLSHKENQKKTSQKCEKRKKKKKKKAWIITEFVLFFPWLR